MSFEPRYYQIAIDIALRACYSEGIKAVALQLATGAGKSHIGSSMVARSVQKGRRVFWITHRRELIKQVSATFAAHGVEHGIIAAGWPGTDRTVQICSIDTLRRRLPTVAPPDFIVWDEARHLGAATWHKVYDAYPKAWHLGLDATPVRQDGTGLGDFFQKMVCGPPMSELIDRGYLVPFRIFAPLTPDLSGLHSRGGDYKTDELARMFDKPTIVGSAVDHYRQFAPGKKALVFCVSIEASKHMAEAFRSAGYAAVHIDGDSSSEIRDGVMADFVAGKIQVLCSVSLFTEGLDVVGVECIIQVRPTQSAALYLQMIGRGLRPAPGKSECVIIDACANWQTHGLPTDDRQWSLESKKKNSRSPNKVSVRVCPACFAAQHSGPPRCRLCGHLFPIDARQVAQVKGELVELQAAMARRAERVEQSRAKSLDDLRALGAAKGREPGWAEHVYAARQAKGRR